MAEGSTTRQRALSDRLGTGETRTYSVVQPVGSPAITQKISTKHEHVTNGTQITVSEGHPWGPKRPPGDVGGEFFTQKKYVEATGQGVSLAMQTAGYPLPGNQRWEFHGPVFAANPSSKTAFPGSGHSSDDDLDELGAEAIARCKPTNPVADVSTFLGELAREGLPSIAAHTWKDRTDLARSAGKDYLNVEFGWLPLVREIKSLSHAIRHAETVLAQYERDSGRRVRRRFNFPVHKSRSEVTIGGGQRTYFEPYNSVFSDGSLGVMVRTEDVVQRRWFSGSFTYHLPSDYDSRKSMARAAAEANKLFGLTPTPETFWNLSPWSWAIDWFSNTGDVISNLTDWATDGLVMHYGYMMEHTIVKHTYTLSKGTLHGAKSAPPPVVYVTETKIRRRANPFGFGVNSTDLSTRQAAILAALGITRR